MSRTRLEPGSQIDGLYVIGSAIGSGGMATVYEATALDTGAAVAVKVLDRQEGANPEGFFNELMLATRVKHPNVVTVKDFGLLDNGDPFIVMERLIGCSLKEHLRRDGPMAPEVALPLLTGTLDALALAHRLGVVHKDLKPANLFLSTSAEGTRSLVVLDFGIASQVGAERGAQIACTPRYAAPEILGKSKLDARYDVYQMGLIIAETLTGEAMCHAKGGRPAFQEHQDGLTVPEALADKQIGNVVRQATARARDDRYTDASQLRDALIEIAPPAPDPRSRTPNPIPDAGP